MNGKLIIVAVADERDRATVRYGKLLATSLGWQVSATTLPKGGAGAAVVRTYARESEVDWLPWADLDEGLAGGNTRILVSARALAAAGDTLWRRVGWSSVYVHHRNVELPGRVLVAAESEATAAALLARLAGQPLSMEVRLIHVDEPPPDWLPSLFLIYGVPLPVDPNANEVRQWLVPREGQQPAAVGAALVGRPLEVIWRATADLSADLLVLGWHRHAFGSPVAAHPIATGLAEDAACDVVLVPVEPEIVANP